MNFKNHLQRCVIKRKWQQLGVAIVLAMVLLLIPITAGTVIPIPTPGLSHPESSQVVGEQGQSTGQTIDLSFPFGAVLVYATEGLTITKSAPEMVDQGGVLTYTLTITNQTGQDVESGIVVDEFSPEVSCNQVVKQPAGWSPGCQVGGIAWIFPGQPNSEIITNGATVDIIYTVNVPQPLIDGYLIVNNDYHIVDSDDPDNPSSGPPVTTTVKAPEWAIVKSVSSQFTEPGQILTYTITATNIGQLDTSGTYTITDSIPNDTTLVDAPDASGSTSLIWSSADPVGALGDTRVVTFSVEVNTPLATGTEIVNDSYAVLGGNTFSPAANAPVTSTVISTATLNISKSASSDPVQVGEPLVYTLTVTNDATAAGPAANLVISDTLPPEVTFQSAGFVGSAEGTVSNPDPSTVVWQLTTPNPLAVNQSIQVTTAVTVDGSLLPAPPLITNNYEVSGSNAPLVSGAIDTTLTPGDPFAITMVADSTLLNVCESTLVMATVFDEWNNPVPNTQMVVYIDNVLPPPPSTPLGNAIITSMTTLTSDVNGVINTYVQGTAHGNVSAGAYEASAGSPFAQTGNIKFVNPSVPTGITVSVAPTLVSFGGTATITAQVQDCLGPMSGQLVTFSMPAMFGTISPETATTDASGIATTMVTAGNIEGAPAITGTVGGVTDVATLQIANFIEVYLPIVLKD